MLCRTKKRGLRTPSRKINALFKRSARADKSGGAARHQSASSEGGALHTSRGAPREDLRPLKQPCLQSSGLEGHLTGATCRQVSWDSTLLPETAGTAAERGPGLQACWAALLGVQLRTVDLRQGLQLLPVCTWQALILRHGAGHLVELRRGR